MALYEYARVSTAEQDFARQEQALRPAGCEVIRAEKVTATRRESRPELALLLEFLRPGETLVVTRGDRLARRLTDLQDLVSTLKARGVTLQATEPPSDTPSAAGQAFLDRLGVCAEFATTLRRERQREGMAAAKARGVYRGRKPSIDPVEVHRLRVEEQLGATAMARRLSRGRASVYRALAHPARRPEGVSGRFPHPPAAATGSPPAHKCRTGHPRSGRGPVVGGLPRDRGSRAPNVPQAERSSPQRSGPPPACSL